MPVIRTSKRPEERYRQQVDFRKSLDSLATDAALAEVSVYAVDIDTMKDATKDILDGTECDIHGSTASYMVKAGEPGHRYKITLTADLTTGERLVEDVELLVAGPKGMAKSNEPKLSEDDLGGMSDNELIDLDFEMPEDHPSRKDLDEELLDRGLFKADTDDESDGDEEDEGDEEDGEIEDFEKSVEDIELWADAEEEARLLLKGKTKRAWSGDKKLWDKAKKAAEGTDNPENFWALTQYIYGQLGGSYRSKKSDDSTYRSVAMLKPGELDEDLWEKAKKAAAKQGHEGDYAYITGIYKKMGGTFQSKSEKSMNLEEMDDDELAAEMEKRGYVAFRPKARLRAKVRRGQPMHRGSMMGKDEEFEEGHVGGNWVTLKSGRRVFIKSKFFPGRPGYEEVDKKIIKRNPDGTVEVTTLKLASAPKDVPQRPAKKPKQGGQPGTLSIPKQQGNTVSVKKQETIQYTAHPDGEASHFIDNLDSDEAEALGESLCKSGVIADDWEVVDENENDDGVCALTLTFVDEGKRTCGEDVSVLAKVDSDEISEEEGDEGEDESEDEAEELEKAFEPLAALGLEVKFVQMEKADEKGIVYGEVYQAGKVDLQDEYAEAEDIEKAMHGWMAKGAPIKLQHGQMGPDEKVVECWMTKGPTPLTKDHTIPENTWVIGVKLSDSSKKLYKEGKLTGFSMGGTKSFAEAQ